MNDAELFRKIKHMPGWVIVLLAWIASIVVCLGSQFLYVARGDGLSGAIAVDLWFCGAIVSFPSLVACWKRPLYFLITVPLAAIAIYSIVLALRASERY